jgi:hypothetical protein
METYDSAWVETQVAQTAEIWCESIGGFAPGARLYSRGEQQVNEDAYDSALREVEEALRPPPITEKNEPSLKSESSLRSRGSPRKLWAWT